MKKREFFKTQERFYGMEKSLTQAATTFASGSPLNDELSIVQKFQM
jgi:hypothetical protein